MNATVDPTALVQALRQELLRLSRLEEDRAAIEASAVPYWSAYPPTVQGHRTAAALLRSDADDLLASTNALTSAMAPMPIAFPSTTGQVSAGFQAERKWS